ncbi:unnamed protein product [Acanthoscelides obtectus]|uniref:Uncharacterized protein n=1 Tax=Acanthoscelides obtectus TaxID=200917 RepID=A0A9P0K0B6_ACAOB|nr:unnamed protein product [Acanthoscelides obtectus]CAK1639083.1 hypothetical protein AOBTE_LOCUS10988 [Acanthoscelides obtectus]
MRNILPIFSRYITFLSNKILLGTVCSFVTVADRRFLSHNSSSG